MTELARRPGRNYRLSIGGHTIKPLESAEITFESVGDPAEAARERAATAMLQDIINASGAVSQAVNDLARQQMVYRVVRHGRQVAELRLDYKMLVDRRMTPEDLMVEAYKALEDVIWEELVKNPPDGMCILPRRKSLET